MSVAMIKNLMADMKFKGMLMSLDQSLTEATSESWSYTDLLDTLLQAEYDFKAQKKIDRHVKASKIRQQASFDSFDFTANRSISKSQIKELYNLKWLEQGRPLLVIGQTGVGKTFIAEAAGLHACQKKYSVLFYTISTLLENIMLARSAGNYLKMRDRLIKPDLLILDDLGLKKFNSLEAHDLCEILEERSNGKSTLITTQLPIDHWSEVIPDPVIADAIIDRVRHTSLILTITGDSYRKVKGKQLDSEKKKN